MERLLMTIATAIVVFAATNVDDLVVLSFLFLVSRADGRLRPWQVVAGQAVGIAVLIASAAVAAVGLVIVPTRWIGLLGLFPLGLGLWRLIAAIRHQPPDNDAPASVAAGLSGVAGVAIINGADNITIYTPMFRHLDAGEVVVTLVVFVAMIAIWAVAAAWLGSHLAAIAAIRRLSHQWVPIVLIAIGAIILTQSMFA
jgi:cadmium resistance protein CadD (predicted permease)